MSFRGWVFIAAAAQFVILVGVSFISTVPAQSNHLLFITSYLITGGVALACRLWWGAVLAVLVAIVRTMVMLGIIGFWFQLASGLFAVTLFAATCLASAQRR